MPALRLMLILEAEEENRRRFNPNKPTKWDFSVRRRDWLLNSDDFNGWTNAGTRWTQATLAIVCSRERERDNWKIEGKEGHACKTSWIGGQIVYGLNPTMPHIILLNHPFLLFKPYDSSNIHQKNKNLTNLIFFLFQMNLILLTP